LRHAQHLLGAGRERVTGALVGLVEQLRHVGKAESCGSARLCVHQHACRFEVHVVHLSKAAQRHRCGMQRVGTR
jgi:hypothetical protein